MPEVPVWQEYFVVQGVGFGGSLASHVPLRILVRFLPAPTAEKLLVTVLLAGFFLGACSLFRAAGARLGPFAPFIAMAAHNYFLYMGFWSFYASLAAALGTVGLLLRHLERPAPGPVRLGLLALASAVTYACHLAGWLILATAAGAIGLSGVAGAWLRRSGVRRTAVGIAGPVLCCLLPAAAFVIQLDWTTPWQSNPAPFP